MTTTATRRLVGQNEAKTPVKTPGGDIYVGMAIYQTGPESFEVVVHNRIYDGVKVDQEHASQPIALEATTTHLALHEGAMHANSMVVFLRSMAVE